jgi:hypothetical protein
MGGMADCGNSCPNTLLAVALFACHTASNRGKYAARATLTFAVEALTCSIAARTVG